MKVSIHHWVQRSTVNPDCGSYRTNVRIESPSVLLAIDLPGHHNRYHAVELALRSLQAEQGKWSPDFLRELWDCRTIKRRKKVCRGTGC